ncbi:MAG: hypothetical protein PF569_07850 [Candidatus Woesearchaeota archaeon]|jgi:predicted component of viral defense system (DUF524 family)|nr:hypothetical protein [Candidatus Woesearchaeota archaeon]
MNYDILSYNDPRTEHEIIICRNNNADEQIKLVIPQDEFSNSALHKVDYLTSFTSVFQQGHFIMSHSMETHNPVENLGIRNQAFLKVRTSEVIKEIQSYQKYWNGQLTEIAKNEPKINKYLNRHFKELEYSSKDLKEAESQIFITTPEHEKTLQYINNLMKCGINPMLKPVLIEELKKLKNHLHHKPLGKRLIDRLDIWGNLKILKSN